MHPILFKIGNLKISTYVCLLCLAFLVGAPGSQGFQKF